MPFVTSDKGLGDSEMSLAVSSEVVEGGCGGFVVIFCSFCLHASYSVEKPSPHFLRLLFLFGCFVKCSL